MTNRLYLTDPYRKKFSARIIKRIQVDDRPAVILDQTALYPGGGGQPADFGDIGGSSIVEMLLKDTDEIVHVLDRPVQDELVNCTIDWPRRFDHMQHHTGQHILSRAFIEVCRSPTVSFHLGKEFCTIDIEASSLSGEEITEVQNLANSVVLSNQYVFVAYYTREQATKMRLRRLPDLDTDRIRLVEIGDFDLTACGGTHVAHTGEVGPIKITGIEKFGSNVRISFLCGYRALKDYATKSHIVDHLSLEFTTGHQELEKNILQMRTDFKNSQYQLRQLRGRLLDYEASELLDAAERKHGFAIVKAVFNERDPAELRLLANKLVSSRPAIALLAVAGPKLQLVFARSESLPQDMSQLLKETLIGFESATGGGKPTFAQGGGNPSSLNVIQGALEKLSTSL